MSHDRFFLDHGAIHDRMTGKHMGMQAEVEWQPRLLSLLNDMWEQITALERSGRTVAAPSPSLGEPETRPTQDSDYWMAAEDILAEIAEAHEKGIKWPCSECSGKVQEMLRKWFPLPSPTAAQGQKAVALNYALTPLEQFADGIRAGRTGKLDRATMATALETIIDACQKRLFASHIPASGWVKCSERMPTESEMPVTVFDGQKQWSAWSFGELAVKNYGITHWKKQGPNPDGTLPVPNVAAAVGETK